MTDFLPLHGEFLEAMRVKYDEIAAHYACDHVGLARNTRRTFANGVVHIHQQCTGCGASVKALQKANFSRAEVAEMPAWDADLARLRDDQRRELEQKWRVHFHRQQERARQNGQRRYDQYLRSPEWAAKRDAVIRRSGGICEGCGMRRATQAHHESYDHLYDEFLWELRAVCRECHERIHATQRSESA
jgi:Fe-S cluster biogenesis protein NfuA